MQTIELYASFLQDTYPIMTCQMYVFAHRLAAEWEDRQAARRNHQKLTQKAEFVSRGTEQIRSAAAGAHLPTTAASMVAQAKAAASRSKWDTRR